MDSSLGPQHTSVSIIEEYISKLQARLKEPWATTCNCMFAFDECRRCKTITRLEKLKSQLEIMKQLEEEYHGGL